MNENFWSLMTTRDGVSAQLTAPRSATSAPDDVEVAPVERVAAEPRRLAPLFRRLRTAAA